MKETKNILFSLFVIISTVSCGLPKETLQRINSTPRVMKEFPLDYAILQPTPTFEQWDNDYNAFNHFLTRDIMKTQIGLSWTDKTGEHFWWCQPSVRTHTQIDTTTMIADKKSIIGEWRIVCLRTVEFADSALYADKKIYRNSRLIDERKDDDVYLSVTEKKFLLYHKEKGKKKFKKLNRSYLIESQRYLMLYNAFKSSAAVSFIGLDKEGNLIINAVSVLEKKIEGKYINYQSTIVQMILKRM